MPAQVGNNHPTPARGEDRRDVNIAVDGIRKSMQQQHRKAITRPCFEIADIEDARPVCLTGANPPLDPRASSELACPVPMSAIPALAMLAAAAPKKLRRSCLIASMA